MSHDPNKLLVVADYLLEQGFELPEVQRMLAAADPVAVVLSKEVLVALDRASSPPFRSWNDAPNPGQRAQMQICNLAERQLLDWIRERRESPWRREYLGEFPR